MMGPDQEFNPVSNGSAALSNPYAARDLHSPAPTIDASKEIYQTGSGPLRAFFAINMKATNPSNE